METVQPGAEDLRDARAASTLRTLRGLLGGYVALSAVTMVVAVLARNEPGMVNDTVWIGGTLVLLSAIVLLLLAGRAARGSRPAYRRARIISVVVLVAIAVIASWPGLLPMWMRVEQVACGLLMLGVVAILFGRRLRALFGAA